jgi:archaellin
MGNNVCNSNNGENKNGKKYKCEGYILNKKTSNIKKAHIEGEVYIYKENNSGKEKLEIKGKWISNTQQKELFQFTGEEIETKNNDKMNKSFRIINDAKNKTNTILPSDFEIILIKYDDKEYKISGRIDEYTELELELNLKLLNEDIHDIQNTFKVQKEL